MVGWTQEYDPFDGDDIQDRVTQYRIELQQSEELGVACWRAHYQGPARFGGSTFYAVDADPDGLRSEQAAALLFFLWYEKRVEYPLCRDLARAYFSEESVR
jgi:hypothetical protein